MKSSQRLEPAIPCKITWHGQGRLLHSVLTYDNYDSNITEAIRKMLFGQIVTAGDTITITRIEYAAMKLSQPERNAMLHGVLDCQAGRPATLVSS